MRRAVGVLGVSVVIAACGNGHDHLSGVIDNLAVPADFVVVGEDRFGPSRPFMGDHPHVSRFYASFLSPDESCELLEGWAVEVGLDEVEDTSSTCGFRQLIGSDWIDLRVTHPLAEIPVEGSLYPIEVDIEYAALVSLHAGP